MKEKQGKAKPDQSLLDEIVGRVSAVPGVMRIVLFGSAAEGRMGPDSDVDLLVVVKDGMHRRRTAQFIYEELSGLGVPKDIVVVTESDVRLHKENASLVIWPALKSGKELYHASR